jgi:hypothetical protein
MVTGAGRHRLLDCGIAEKENYTSKAVKTKRKFRGAKRGNG